MRKLLIPVALTAIGCGDPYADMLRCAENMGAARAHHFPQYLLRSG